MKKILLLSVIAILSASCNDVLDMPYDGRFTLKEIFSDFDLTKGYVNKCYSYMPGGGIINDYAMYYDGTLLSSFCDEAQDTRDALAGTVQNWYLGNLTAVAFPLEDYWSLYYEGIRTCNIFLKEIDAAPFLEGRPAYQGEARSWKAQVYALRAFYFWQIVKRYGPAPILTEPVSDDEDYSEYERASFAKCVDAIIADCEAAILNGLKWTIGSGLDGDRGRMSLAVVYAIESEAALYAASDLWNTEGDRKAKWEWAAEITGKALNQCLSNGYELFSEVPVGDALESSASAYQTYFFTPLDVERQKDKETIYESKIQLAMWRDAGLPTSTSTLRSGPCPSQELVDAYEMDNGEPAFELDEDGCVIYDGLEPRINAASDYDPANPYAGRDPRLTASVYYNGTLLNYEEPSTAIDIYEGGDCSVSATDQRHTRTGYYTRKFHHNRSSSSNQADGYMKIFRLGELYLNFAEAANEAYGPVYMVPTVDGSVKTAMQAVNAVRARAGMPDFPSGITKEDFRIKYRNERRIELAFEQHRFYDVRRWNILEKTDGRISGMNITRTVQGEGEEATETFGYERFEVQDRQCNTEKYLLFPLPVSEVSKMEYYTGTDWQNSGW